MRKQKNRNEDRFQGVGPDLVRALSAWFVRQQRILPWREDPSPYRVWISEIMLQQTQVITVKPYFERFIEKFPTVEDLAVAPSEAVMLAWAGLGYYSRARNLHLGAKKIVAEGFPSSRDAWLEMPGVGPYTAGAVCSIALNQAEALVDGNVERVLSRICLVNREGGETVYREKLWTLARASVAAATAAKISYSNLNQGWMELGAVICTPKKPKCMFCPVREFCGAFSEGRTEEFPQRKAPKEWIHVEERRSAVFSTDGKRVALVQAKTGEWRAGLWDFPELLPQGWKTREIGAVDSKHVVTRHKIRRKTSAFFLVGEAGGLGEDLRWVSMTAPEVALGSAPKKVLELLRERFF